MGNRYDRDRSRRGGELNRGDYRGDFGPEGYPRFGDPSRDHDRHDHDDRHERHDRRHSHSSRESHEPSWQERRHEQTANEWQWRRMGREGWQRGRVGGGYGSPYDAWSAGVGRSHGGSGGGPEDRPGRGGFADEDWQVTRPARGRGAWAGDWEEAADRNAPRGQEDYRGRGPKGYRRSDDRIREEACERLTDDWSVDATDVSVQVQDGEVTLTGFVPSREQKRRAEECVERIPGVRDVINQLRIGSAAGSDAQLQGERQERGGGTPPANVAAERARNR